jgi:pyrroline-5-carboxylate reductase
MSLNPTWGFLGAGRMAIALARGFLTAGWVRAEEILASDLDRDARERFSREVGGRTTAVNREVAAAPTLVVAVKPPHVSEVLREIREVVGPQHLVISIAAGITIAQLERELGPGTRVVRVMPNTPALVGASATAFALGNHCATDVAGEVQRWFGSVGIAFALPERLLDAVTGLSGSGPAYAFLMIEALSDGGVAEGLPREVATRLAAQTLIGAAQMVLQTGHHPGALKDQVSSPGGTTIEGLQVLEEQGVRAGLIRAVRAATRRSRELSGMRG